LDKLLAASEGKKRTLVLGRRETHRVTSMKVERGKGKEKITRREKFSC